MTNVLEAMDRRRFCLSCMAYHLPEEAQPGTPGGSAVCVTNIRRALADSFRVHRYQHFERRANVIRRQDILTVVKDQQKWIKLLEDELRPYIGVDRGEQETLEV